MLLVYGCFLNIVAGLFALLTALDSDIYWVRLVFSILSGVCFTLALFIAWAWMEDE